MTNNTLWNAMEVENNITSTTNGDKAYKSTLNPLMDFMFTASSLRNADEISITKLFTKAYNFHKVYATRLAFYVRDIRGGQGERRVFRACMKTLAEIDPETFKQIINFVPEYGRWDDLVELLNSINNSDLEKEILNIIIKQYKEDIDNFNNNKPISILAKWMPSINASSETTIKSAKKLAKYIGVSHKDYRKMLSLLRKHLNVVEVDMSAKNWSNINYEHVPAKAMLRYKNAFNKNDTSRFQDYVNALSNPNSTTKINASTLYPFDIVNKVFHLSENDPVLDAQWKALPDYFGDKFDNALVVCDTSGSMYGTPINVAIGLSMYLAERNKGLFNNKFITFSNHPELQEICGKNIFERVRSINDADWGMNTDIASVFKLILNSAVNNKLTQADMPSMLYIISDMQFDCCSNFENVTVFEKYQKEFENNGYKLPTVVFWNVAGESYNNMPITVSNTGAIVCSGYSPSIVKYIMESDVTDTNQLIENIVRSKRYANILAE